MTFEHLAVTITTTNTGQPISATPAGDALEIWFQPNAANSGAMYLGGPGVSNTAYGVRLEAPTDSIPPAPFSPGRGVSPVALPLNEMWVAGTEGDILRVLIVKRAAQQ